MLVCVLFVLLCPLIIGTSLVVVFCVFLRFMLGYSRVFCPCFCFVLLCLLVTCIPVWWKCFVCWCVFFVLLCLLVTCRCLMRVLRYCGRQAAATLAQWFCCYNFWCPVSMCLFFLRKVMNNVVDSNSLTDMAAAVSLSLSLTQSLSLSLHTHTTVAIRRIQKSGLYLLLQECYSWTVAASGTIWSLPLPEISSIDYIKIASIVSSPSSIHLCFINSIPSSMWWMGYIQPLINSIDCFYLNQLLLYLSICLSTLISW